MKVFYSHPIKLYGTAAERREISLIERRFSGCEIVDPSALQSNPEPGKETEYYLGVLDGCDCMVFSRSHGYVTEGVRKEVEHALGANLPVYELREGSFVEVHGQVANLPMIERIVLRARDAFGIARREAPKADNP